MSAETKFLMFETRHGGSITIRVKSISAIELPPKQNRSAGEPTTYIYAGSVRHEVLGHFCATEAAICEAEEPEPRRAEVDAYPAGEADPIELRSALGREASASIATASSPAR